MNSPNPAVNSADRRARLFIWAASLAIPLVVGILYVMPKVEAGALRFFLNGLPLFNALCNGTTAMVLILAFIAIRRKRVVTHKRLMTLALILSLLFLLSYVTYHATSESTRFPETDALRPLYVSILLSHILLSAIVVPLVLISYSRGLAQRYDKHRRIARVTLPIWIYVAITGVLVYILIRPYYPF
jgi:putative membrane protein